MEPDSAVIAIVDDDPMMLSTYEALFKHLRLPVSFVADSGPSAVEKIKGSSPKPTIMVIDYRMPLMSGIELACEVKKLLPGVKIIFCSGDEDVREEAMSGGGDAFLRKPSRIRDFRECIRELSLQRAATSGSSPGRSG